MSRLTLGWSSNIPHEIHGIEIYDVALEINKKYKGINVNKCSEFGAILLIIVSTMTTLGS